MVHKIRFGRWMVTAPVVLTLAACTTSPAPDPAGPTSPAASASSAGPSATPTGSPTPTPAATALPAAADGTRLSACRDGRCEVVVTADKAIQLDDRFGIYALHVVSVQDDEVALFAPMIGGGGSFGCDGDDRCQVSVVGASGEYPANANLTAHPGARLAVGKLRISVLAVAQRKAVLRLTTA
jgi:hypothetical protein